MSIETRTATSRALIVAVQLPDVSDIEFESSLKELGELARTLGFEVVGTFTQKRTSFDAMAYVGAGKREEMRLFAENNADFVLVDHDISPSQAGNLEKEVGCQ
ncbi:MAG: GTPase HflX, partial [bacterium]